MLHFTISGVRLYSLFLSPGYVIGHYEIWIHCNGFISRGYACLLLCSHTILGIQFCQENFHSRRNAIAYQPMHSVYYIDGLVHERPNSSALAMELCPFCTNPSIWYIRIRHIIWHTHVELKLLFRHSLKTINSRVTGLCEGNPPMTAQRASNVENVSIWWRHHDYGVGLYIELPLMAWITWKHFCITEPLAGQSTDKFSTHRESNSKHVWCIYRQYHWPLK